MRTADADTAIDPYQMANLAPRTTGLPLTVWVSPRGGARHEARIKVCLTPGKMLSDHIAVVGIQPKPWPVTGGLSAADFAEVARWITLNEAALLAYWDESIDTAELITLLKKP